jgi:arabinogalactan oligomer/maltooligosaccharide transport system permease protein
MKDFTLDFVMNSLGSVGSAVIGVIIAVALLEVLVWIVFKHVLRFKKYLVVMLLAPAAVGLLLLIVYPLIYELIIAFSDMTLRNFRGLNARQPFFVFIGLVCFALAGAALYFGIKRFLPKAASRAGLITAGALIVAAALSVVAFPEFFDFSKPLAEGQAAPRVINYGLDIGFQNFADIFTLPVNPQGGETFFPLFLRTFLWTIIQVSFHVAFGLGLALLLNRKIRFRGIFRALLVIPWAVPQVVASLAWRGEFNYDYGYVNIVLKSLGLAPVQWMSDPVWNFVAMNIVNIWLGIPFMMITLLGGLQSIDPTYYEAAEIDGASSFQRFRKITLPLLQPVMTPAVVLGIIWTFNNFNVPFFINQNELPTSDILVTALFRLAFEYYNYKKAAAFAFVIFFILMGLAIVYMKVTNFQPVRRGKVAKAIKAGAASAILAAPSGDASGGR